MLNDIYFTNCVLVQKMERIEKELTEKLSLVKTECNVRARPPQNGATLYQNGAVPGRSGHITMNREFNDGAYKLYAHII